MNETQAHIGAIVKTRFAYHDLEKDTIAFKSRPFLIIGAEYDKVPCDFTAFPIESRDLFITGVTTIVPIFASGKRLGSLILARMFPAFDSSDLILAEHGATVIGIELLHSINLRTEEATRVTTLIQIAIKSLSFSELEAVKAIFESFPSLEERITASKIAEEKNITRSVIVNALRKLESAGILETRSLGM